MTIPVTATVKRLQLNITSNTGAPAGQIAEFEVYGTAAQNPDLTITDMSWTPSSPIENDDITLRATVKNIGAVEAGATTLNYYLNADKAGSSPVAPLAAGASTTVTLQVGTKAAGSYSVSAKVDEDNEIMEQNNENNSYSHASPLVIGAVESSDLVGTVQWTPATPVAGNAVAFTVNLKNQGNKATASGSHAISVALKNPAGSTIQTLTGSYDGALAAGSSASIHIPGMDSGKWRLYSNNNRGTRHKRSTLKRENNVSQANLTVYSARGASMPYTRYDTDDALRGGGAQLKTAPTFDQALTASEASGRVMSRFLPTGPIWVDGSTR